MGSLSEYARAANISDKNKETDYSSPTTKPSAKQKARRNIMLERFNADVRPSVASCKYVPKPFFFYGTLTDPLRLQETLQLPEPPVLKPARVQRYKIMLWGQYPALVPGPMSSYVDGMAYIVETEQQQQMLEYYETRAYCVVGIRITIEGKWVPGRTFLWHSDPTELVEGEWSLQEWKKEVEEEMASHFRPLEE